MQVTEASVRQRLRRPVLRLYNADWAFVPSPKGGLVLIVAHGGNILHIPVSLQEARAVAGDLAMVSDHHEGLKNT